MADLNAASLEDVSRFFKTYYAPNNAALVIVGDIQVPEAKKLIETYFADIPAQPQPKRPDLTEPAEFHSRKETYKDPLARVPAVVIGYPGPKRNSPDFFALRMIDAILTAGDSAQLRMDLVKGKQSVIQYEAELGWPFASALDYRDPEAYAMFLLHKPTFTGDQIVAQVQDEIARLQKEPMGEKELERIKTQVRALRIKELQSSFNRARALAQYELADGNPKLINTDLDSLMAVTAAQIQETAKKYLTPDKRVVLEIVPAPKPPANREGAKGTTKEGQ
jgi:predicted Zn-dependent peptidase